MATKIIKGEHGFAISFDGEKIAINKIVDEGKTLSLPQNPSNRRYFSIAAFEKHQVNGELELTYKPTVTIGNGPRASRKPLEDFLEGKDRDTYLKLVAQAEEARKAASVKPKLTAVEKLQQSIARNQAKLDALTKAGE